MNSLLPRMGSIRKLQRCPCTPSLRKYTYLTPKSQEPPPYDDEKAEVSLTGEWGPLLVISYELAPLELRTSLDELLAMLVGGKLLEVLDKALSQILSLRLPLSGISVGVSWIEDSGIYAW